MGGSGRCSFCGAAFAAIAATTTSSAATTALGGGCGRRCRFGRRFSWLRFGFGIRVGLGFGRSRFVGNHERFKHGGILFERSAGFRNRERRRCKLAKVELRIGNELAAEARGSFLRLRFPIRAAKTRRSGGVPLRGFRILAGCFENAREFERDHRVLRLFIK